MKDAPLFYEFGKGEEVWDKTSRRFFISPSRKKSTTTVFNVITETDDVEYGECMSFPKKR